MVFGKSYGIKGKTVVMDAGGNTACIGFAFFLWKNYPVKIEFRKTKKQQKRHHNHINQFLIGRADGYRFRMPFCDCRS